MEGIRVVYEHEVIPEDDYHEWINLGHRIKADSLGRLNHRMYETNWSEWTCNNWQCPATVWVHDDFIRSTLNDLAPLP